MDEGGGALSPPPLQTVMFKLFAEYINFLKLAIPKHFISLKKAPNDAVTPPRQSQYTPKMKANVGDRSTE